MARQEHKLIVTSIIVYHRMADNKSNRWLLSSCVHFIQVDQMISSVCDTSTIPHGISSSRVPGSRQVKSSMCQDVVGLNGNNHCQRWSE